MLQCSWANNDLQDGKVTVTSPWRIICEGSALGKLVTTQSLSSATRAISNDELERDGTDGGNLAEVPEIVQSSWPMC
jgi:hypothetical protein